MITVADPIDADTLRIRHEFLTLPDLRVSVDHASTLLNVPARHARLILESLVGEGFLERTPDDHYLRSRHQAERLDRMPL